MSISFDDLIPKQPGASAAPSPLSPEERDIAIRTIYGEAARESPEGKAAVAAVIRNRLRTGRWGKSVSDVVLAQNQFEPWNTPEGQARMEALRADDPVYQEIGSYVDDVFGGRRPDPTGGATHFFAPRAQAALGRNVPAWARGQQGRPIGNHTFYAPEGRVTDSGPNFDDLVPGGAPSGAQGGESGISFEDLIPQNPAAQGQARAVPGGQVAQFGSPGAELVQAEWPSPPVPQATQENSLAADAIRQLGGGGWKGLGSTIRGVGAAAQVLGEYTTTPIINALLGTTFKTQNLLDPAADVVGGVGEGLQSRIDPATKQIIKKSTPQGDILRPETWSFGVNPSLRGYVFHGLDVFGQMLPTVAAAIGTSGLGQTASMIAGAGVGGAQGGGAAVEEARQIIDTLFTQGKLAQTSPLYHRLLTEGKSPAEALEETKRNAELAAFLLTTPVSALGGAATGAILNPAVRLAPGGRLIQGVVKGVAGGLEEGIQEVVESVQTRQGVNLATGTQIPVTEGTFGDFVLGALGGGTTAAAGGVATRPLMPARRPELSPEVLEHYLQTASQGPVPDTVIFSAASAEPSPIWYSQVRRVIEEKGPQAASGAQWLATLENTPGVKREEISDLGLDSYFLNRDRVTKNEVIGYLEEKQIDVKEVLQTSIEGDPRVGELRAMARGDVPFDRARHTELIAALDGIRDPQYEDYIAPGPQKNYRELLLMTPRNPEVVQAELEGDVERQRDLRETEFRGSHWDMPNVVAHVRSTERVDNTNTPVLHIEEIQSDWHQQGRKRGYRGAPLTPQDIDFEQVSLSDAQTDLGSMIDSHLVPYRQARGIDLNAPVIRYRLKGSTLGWSYLFDPQTTRYDAFTEGVNTIGSEIFNEAKRRQDGVVVGPFKTAWPELAFKRMLRWAADNGYKRITWTTGKLAGDYAAGGLPAIHAARKGLVEFYDKIVPGIAKKWAKKLGGSVGTTMIPVPRAAPRLAVGYGTDGTFAIYDENDLIIADGFNTRGEAYNAKREIMNRTTNKDTPVWYIDIPPTAQSIVRRGLPMYSATGPRTAEFVAPASSGSAQAPQNMRDPQYLRAGRKMAEVLQSLIRQMKIDASIRIHLSDAHPDYHGWVTPRRDGSYDLYVNPTTHVNPGAMWATAAHEFGHIVMFEKFAKAPDKVKVEIEAAFERWREANSSPNRNIQQLLRTRDNAIVNYYNMRGDAQFPLYMLTPEHRKYYSSFEEWFAEQVARWATTSDWALTVVDKFFENLGKWVRKVVEAAYKKFGLEFRAEPVMQQWLDSFITEGPAFMHELMPELHQRTREANQGALDATLGDGVVEAAPRAPGTQTIEDATYQVVDGGRETHGPQIRERAAHVDNWHKYYKYWKGLDQLAAVNPNFAPLLRYKERMDEMHNETSQIYDKAIELLKAWRSLGKKRGESIVAALDDIVNMRYRTDDEIQRGIARHPTQEELQAIYREHRVDQESARMIQRLNQMFDAFLQLTADNARAEAQRLITDPQKLAERLDKINTQVRNLRRRPYFPFYRFGRHFVHVRDAAGNTVHFETTERRGLRSAERMQEIKAKELREAFPDATVEVGALPEVAEPFIGMPPALLESIANELNLSQEQRDAIQQLQFEMSPANSFKHRFQHKNYMPGYSMDFKRAFANYFFYGGKHYARTKYAWELRGLIRAARGVGGNKAAYVADYMQDHLENTVLNAKGDIGGVKAAAFIWFLGFSPAAAAINMSQVPLVSYPFLAAKFGGIGFGDARATRALLDAMRIETFLPRNKFKERDDFLARAMEYGITTGRITDTQAHELAGATQAENLFVGFGGNAAQRVAQTILEKSAWMFEKAEQFNRRLTFRAALDLAQAHPNAQAVKDATNLYKDEILTLRNKGFTEAEAAAVVTAIHATMETQFNYNRWARPRFVRGKFTGTLFIYKKYLQSMLAVMGQNKSDVMPRAFLMMAMMGGLMGLPGMEDLTEILKALGHHLFGRDFDLKDETREFVLEQFNGRVPPDIVLHGLARRGFGIPAMLDMMGGVSTGRGLGRGLHPGAGHFVPAPSFDLSRNLSMGQLSPIPLEALIGPPMGQQQAWMQMNALQRGAGPVFGTGFALFHALRDFNSDPTDFKRWERIMPRALASGSRAYRSFSEGRERTRGGVNAGSTVVRYDPRDPEQMAEILAQAMGFAPTRLNARWEQLIEERKQQAYYDTQRAMLLRQMFDARLGGDEREQERVVKAIQRFNSRLPPEARSKSITGEVVRRSMASRMRERQARETGVPTQRTARPMAEKIRQMYPEAQIDLRVVR
jgi:hypothetical protein